MHVAVRFDKIRFWMALTARKSASGPRKKSIFSKSPVELARWNVLAESTTGLPKINNQVCALSCELQPVNFPEANSM